MPSLNTKIMSDLLIYYPSIGEQRAIAHLLGTLDDRIALNHRMNETLEAMAGALFKSWFVDFDPVRAKAEGRNPGLPKHIADLFPDSFEGSELGEIPKGWAIRKIGDIAQRVGMGPFGSSIKVETFVSDGVPVISGQHLDGFMIEDSAFNFVTHDHAEVLKSANVERGDVIFTHAGNIGQVAYIPEGSRFERYVISQRQFFMRCDKAQVTPTFIVFYFKSPEGKYRLLANTSSSGVPSIARPVTYLRSIQLSIPPSPIMESFERMVRPILHRFRSNLNEVVILAALRDRLLPKFISGQIPLNQAEKFVEVKM
jgi:type I restriction enzyme S subunit